MTTVADLPFVGGHVALDFVNTAEERGHADSSDMLRAPADLLGWGERYGLISAPAGDGDQAEFQRAIEARELLYAVFFARRADELATPGQLARLSELGATAYRAGELRRDDDGTITWTWDTARLDTIRHIAVTSAIDLLRAEPSARLKQCPGDHCGWFFLDTTKRGNRRWCSMAECGQDAKDEYRRAQRQARLSR
ncbi:MAG TPA: ABATE domain-containing protein [Streptosporangiaceae bacterium]|jgi:predicted RNA-binding Zn ribbon-like protein